MFQIPQTKFTRRTAESFLEAKSRLSRNGRVEDNRSLLASSPFIRQEGRERTHSRLLSRAALA